MKHSSISLILGAFATTTFAHTWIEQLMVIAPNGTLVGEPGFPRGNVKRGAPGFGDPAMVNLIPPNDKPINTIDSSEPMCKSTQQSQTQTNGSPRLQAAAGSNVALRYQENGHVSLPANQPGKPDNRGTIYVYGTTDPQPDDKFLSIHRVWNADGTGGDKRGVLLSTRDYDDGQCYQVNGGAISVQRQKQFVHTANQLMGADLWCQTDIQIPTAAPEGKPYTLYWVWDWPTLPGTAGFPDGKQEIYTTCMDVDVVSGDNSDAGQVSSGNAGTGSNKAAGAAAVKFAQGQDLGNAAVAAQLNDIANPTAVSGQVIPFSAQETAVGAGSGATASGRKSQSGAAQATASVTATQAVTSPQDQSIPAHPTQTGDNNGDNNRGGPGNFGPGNGFHHGRPSVSPIGPDSPPAPQETPSNNPAPGSDNNNNNNGNKGNNDNQPQANSPASNINSNTAAAANPNAAATATITQAGAAKTVTQIQTLVSTVIETKMETVFSKRAAATTPTSSGAVAAAPTETQRCSKTESVYRLRARNAFYVVQRPDARC